MKGKGILWHKEQRIFEVSNGFYFGDSLIMEFESHLEFSAGKEQTFCFYIPAHELNEICSRYPDSKTVFQDLAFRRAEYLKLEINKKLDKQQKLKKLNTIDSFIEDEDNILQERTRGNILKIILYLFIHS